MSISALDAFVLVYVGKIFMAKLFFKPEIFTAVLDFKLLVLFSQPKYCNIAIGYKSKASLN